MPERDKAVTFLTEDLIGSQLWDGRDGECKTMPKADYYAVRDLVDAMFVRLVERMNTNRVLQEASVRCDRSGHKEHDDIFPTPCGECLADALLGRASGFGMPPVPMRERAHPLPKPMSGESELPGKAPAVELARALGYTGEAARG